MSVEREISSGAMLGIVLLALAAVIGLGFGVFAIAKGVANEGTVNVQDSLSTVSSQVFLDYDQKIITGTQAISAMKNFEGKPYAVLISTKALMQDQLIAPAVDHPKAYLTGDANTTFIAYNAVLAANPDGGAPVSITGGTKRQSLGLATTYISLINGTYVAPFGFTLLDGNVVYDNNTGGMYKSGNAEFVPTSTKFQANVIKDKSGAYVGIALRQM
jgi:hypothetical protein